MKTQIEIYEAAAAAAKLSLAEDTNLAIELSRSSSFQAAGGSDPADYDLYARYWNDRRQFYKSIQGKSAPSLAKKPSGGTSATSPQTPLQPPAATPPVETVVAT